MKKFLLSVCVAVAAMTANAQELQNVVFKHQPVKVTDIQTEMLGTAERKSALAEKIQNAPAMGGIYGTYIEDAVDEIHACSKASLSAVTEDGKEYVKLVIDNEVVSIYGEYDESTGVINCGAQQFAGGGDATGYNFEIYGIEVDPETEKMTLTTDLSFTIDDDNVMTCDQAGYVMYITDEGQYQGYTWDGAHIEPIFYKANGVHSGDENGRSTGNKWAEFSVPVAIEDMEYSVNVYGFAGMGCLSIDVNEDGTVSIPMGQPMIELGLEDPTEIETYGAYLCLYGVDKVENDGIQTNTDKEVTVGTIEGNTITVTEYTRVCSKFDEGGSGYAKNWYADGMTFTLNEGNYKICTGIENVTNTLEERAKSSKTFNLLGQQVNRQASKGLLIRDGKKYIKK